MRDLSKLYAALQPGNNFDIELALAVICRLDELLQENELEADLETIQTLKSNLMSLLGKSDPRLEWSIMEVLAIYCVFGEDYEPDFSPHEHLLPIAEYILHSTALRPVPNESVKSAISIVDALIDASFTEPDSQKSYVSIAKCVYFIANDNNNFGSDLIKYTRSQLDDARNA